MLEATSGLALPSPLEPATFNGMALPLYPRVVLSPSFAPTVAECKVGVLCVCVCGGAGCGGRRSLVLGWQRVWGGCGQRPGSFRGAIAERRGVGRRRSPLACCLARVRELELQPPGTGPGGLPAGPAGRSLAWDAGRHPWPACSRARMAPRVPSGWPCRPAPRRNLLRVRQGLWRPVWVCEHLPCVVLLTCTKPAVTTATCSAPPPFNNCPPPPLNNGSTPPTRAAWARRRPRLRPAACSCLRRR